MKTKTLPEKVQGMPILESRINHDGRTFVLASGRDGFSTWLWLDVGFVSGHRFTDLSSARASLARRSA
jgi:hypothetical protein